MKIVLGGKGADLAEMASIHWIADAQKIYSDHGCVHVFFRTIAGSPIGLRT